MKFYIVKDAQNLLHVVGSIGFVPEGAICPAPEGAEGDDGRFITLAEVVREPESPAVIVASLDHVAKSQAKETERTANESEKAIRAARRTARLAKLTALSAFKGKSLTASEMKQFVEFLVEELFNADSTFAADLVRYAAEAKK